MNGMRELIVHVGAGLDAEGIKEVLNEPEEYGEANNQLFSVAHALLSDHKDDRAEVNEVGVDSVTRDFQHPSQVVVQMTISWSAYYGCKDMDTSDDETVTESATYTAEGDLVFLVPVPRREASEC
jgi:hypothetical protein